MGALVKRPGICGRTLPCLSCTGDRSPSASPRPSSNSASLDDELISATRNKRAGKSNDFPFHSFSRVKDSLARPRDWETLQPLPFQYSSRIRPKYFIDNPEGKRIVLPAVFKDG